MTAWWSSLGFELRIFYAIGFIPTFVLFIQLLFTLWGGSDDLTEQLPKLVEEQVKATANLKIDSVTVWESGKRNGGKTSTADFVSGLAGSLRPFTN